MHSLGLFSMVLTIPGFDAEHQPLHTKRILSWWSFHGWSYTVDVECDSLAIVIITPPGSMVATGRTLDTPTASLVPRDLRFRLVEQSLRSVRAFKLGMFLTTTFILKVVIQVDPYGVG